MAILEIRKYMYIYMNPTASHLNKYLKDTDTALFQAMIVEMENLWFQLIKMFFDIVHQFNVAPRDIILLDLIQAGATLEKITSECSFFKSINQSWTTFKQQSYRNMDNLKRTSFSEILMLNNVYSLLNPPLLEAFFPPKGLSGESAVWRIGRKVGTST